MRISASLALLLCGATLALPGQGKPSAPTARAPLATDTLLRIDGVAFSIAELDSDFVRRRVIVALTADGAPMNNDDGPLRIIVEGEGRPARWIRQLTGLRVQKAPVADTLHR